jgi:hypothetical protein
MRRLWRRLTGMILTGHREGAFADELAAHLQAHVDDNVRLG